MLATLLERLAAVDGDILGVWFAIGVLIVLLTRWQRRIWRRPDHEASGTFDLPGLGVVLFGFLLGYSMLAHLAPEIFLIVVGDGTVGP